MLFRRSLSWPFQSTHPVRGATMRRDLRCHGMPISIHAPRAGCDCGAAADGLRRADFNPRTPCGVRRFTPVEIKSLYAISIHAPRAGCDKEIKVGQVTGFISIHAPRAGCDKIILVRVKKRDNFNPRTPCGVRRLKRKLFFCLTDFNPRTPCGVRLFDRKNPFMLRNFNPRTPCGVRLVGDYSDKNGETFQSTHPVRGATANLTVLPDQICARGTKKSLFSRKNAQKRK